MGSLNIRFTVPYKNKMFKLDDEFSWDNLLFSTKEDQKLVFNVGGDSFVFADFI